MHVNKGSDGTHGLLSNVCGVIGCVKDEELRRTLSNTQSYYSYLLHTFHGHMPSRESV
jgi:hypothetical protein